LFHNAAAAPGMPAADADTGDADVIDTEAFDNHIIHNDDDDEAMFSSPLFYACVGIMSGVVIVGVVVAVVCYLLVCSQPRRHHVHQARLLLDGTYGRPSSVCCL